MSSWFWPDYRSDIQEFKPTSACRNCPAAIDRIAAGWVDRHGFLNCRKDIPHEPMPVALDGEQS